MPALLVIDVQNDFCPGGALAVKDGDKIIGPINEVIGLFSKNGWPICASRDWHHPDTEHFKKWPPHCIQSTRGASFHSDLKITGATYVITKGASKKDDGYSPFEGKFYNLSLDDLLKIFGVTKLFVCGLATDYCVKAACLDAARPERNYLKKVYLLTDACKAVNLNPVDEANALEEMRRAGVIFTTTDEVLR